MIQTALALIPAAILITAGVAYNRTWKRRARAAQAERDEIRASAMKHQ